MDNWFDRISAGRELKTLLSVVKCMQRLGQCSRQSLLASHQTQSQKLRKAAPKTRGGGIFSDCANLLLSVLWSGVAVSDQLWSFIMGSNSGILERIGKNFLLWSQLGTPWTRPSKTSSCRWECASSSTRQEVLASWNKQMISSVYCFFLVSCLAITALGQ